MAANPPSASHTVVPLTRYTQQELGEILGEVEDPFGVAYTGLTWRAKERHFGVRRDGRLVAHTGLVRLPVTVGTAETEVVCFGGVAVAPDLRGQRRVRNRQRGSPTGVRIRPSSAWSLGASFGQSTRLRHRERVRPLLLRLVTATAVLLATSGCVSLPAGGSVHGPGPAPGGRTVAPARPSPLVAPSKGASRERLVDVASARHKPGRRPKAHKKKAHKKGVVPGHAAAVDGREQSGSQAAAHPPRSVPSGERVRPPVHTGPRQRHAEGARRRANPAPGRRGSSVDPGVMCRMASGRVRPDLVQLCRSAYGR